MRIRVSVLTNLVAAAGIAMLPLGASALDPGPKCEAGKHNECAKKAKGLGNVASKSIKKNEAQDAVKLGKISTKFNDKWAKLETKGAGACPTNGDVASVEAAIEACIDDIITDLGGAPQGAGDEVKCQSKKMKEAGKYAQCRFKATSKGIKKGLAPDYTKCNDKITLKWAKIEAKPPCGTTGDLAAVQADIDACHGNIIGGLAGGPVCGNGFVEAGETCDDGNTTPGDGCDASCQIEGTILYTQDFESMDPANPDALGTNPGGDGWLVGANVFAGAAPGGAFLYNYFAFTAPNGGAAFSAVATGQGGVDQGAQQLSIYNDYNNADHGNPDTIEAVVFREHNIVLADAGNTFTFSFEHKIGNINDPADATCMAPNPACASTASAFIKVLDPGSGFAVVVDDTADMTSIPATWGGTQLSVDVTAAMDGMILQVGFQSRASHFQPTGIFYDNILWLSTPTP